MSKYNQFTRPAKGLAFSGSDSLGFDSFFAQTARSSASTFEHQKAATFLSDDGSIKKEIRYTHSKCPLCSAKLSHSFLFKKQGYSHWLCTQCEGIYVNPCLKQRVLYKEVYGNSEYPFVSVVNSTLQSRYDENRFNDALDIVQSVFRNPSILDLGCGGGLFIKIARERGIRNILGCDVLNRAVDHAASIGLQGSVYLKPAEDILAANVSYDVISMWELLDHVLFPNKLLQLAIKRLNLGGLLMISVRNSQSLASQVLREKAEMFLGYAHLNFWNKKHFSRIAETYNYSIIDYYTYISYSEPVVRSLSYVTDSASSLRSLLSPGSILDSDMGYKIVCIIQKISK